MEGVLDQWGGGGPVQVGGSEWRTGSVEFSATANVLPARHLLVFVSEATDGGDSWAPVAAEGADPQALTKREREVVTLVAAGLQSGDIAERLFLSPETVKSHVHNAMAKLGSRTRAHAVAMALVTGQITWET